MDLETLAWEPELLDAVGVPAAMLPAIRSLVRGLRRGRRRPRRRADRGRPRRPAGGAVRPGLLRGRASASAPTAPAASCSCTPGERPVHSSHGLITTVAARLGDGAGDVRARGVRRGRRARSSSGCATTSGSSATPSEVEALARSVPDSGDVVFVPAFSGLFAPHWRSDARGVIAGLTALRDAGAHRPGRARGDRLPGATTSAWRWPPTSGRHCPGELRVDGGMIRNELLMQFQADILGRPVVAPRIAETSALGAAYAAGLAVGFWRGPRRAAGDGSGRPALGAGDGRGRRGRPGSPAGTRAWSGRSAGSTTPADMRL